jgi:EAL domain-containing protein (putative c-di-GMP-specific phosphodiesterase class I)/GGDEF domain-containing protein
MTRTTGDLLDNEHARLNALRDLNLLDTPPSESFDRLTRLASELLKAPVSTISLTDSDRQWFKSTVGVDLAEIPRHQAPCHYAIQGDAVFVVPDLLEDQRFASSPLAAAGIRFYAGAPLFTRAGYGLGTLCVIDTKPRVLQRNEAQVLKDLAGMVMCQVELQNMIGRVDAGSGLANQYQLFEDLGGIAVRTPEQPIALIAIDVLSPAQANQIVRSLGTSHVEAIVKAAMTLLRSKLGRDERFYHVGQMRCVVMADAGLLETHALAEQLIAALADPITIAGIPITLEPAVGLYDFIANESLPTDSLRRAINALDDARQTGMKPARYDKLSDQRAARRFALVNDFATALTVQDQLSLVYQPRVDLASGRWVGAEALLRWNHPTLGVIPPTEFVPLVERTALARAMTEWVAKRAIVQVREWEADGHDLNVSINASALNLQETDFASRFLGWIEHTRVSPKRVELEFTEGAFAADTNRVVAQLQQLCDGGISVAIDNFGTGYSNLSYLQQLPATVLKIDQSFVRRLDSSEKDRLLVRTLIDMASSLGYRIVAEGIETETVYRMLADWGCDEGQGYWMARPGPAELIPAGRTRLAA